MNGKKGKTESNSIELMTPAVDPKQGFVGRQTEERESNDLKDALRAQRHGGRYIEI